ncbi:MAG TPA: amidohydrolase family protein [Woeseiaceae bacterium]|nr:amidohydrolase family protein [Woeseiaceae bacterium]
MRCLLVVSLLVLAACSERGTEPGSAPAASAADLVLTNARVYTVDADASWAEAVAIRGDRIVYVGDAAGAEALEGEGTKVVDVGGRLVLPAFQDVHIHPISGGVEASACDLNAMETVAEYRGRIAEYAQANPDVPWILGGGWSMAAFGPGARASKGILDELVPDRPVLLYSRDGHSAWANSKALEIAGITKDTPDPPDGIIDRDPETGEPVGSLQEGAASLVARHVPETTPEMLAQGLRFARDMLHEYGITSIQVAYAHEPDLKAYTEMDAAGDLDLRIVASLWWERDQTEEQIPHLKSLRETYTKGNVRATTVKIMQDGVMENYTAVMLEPYLLPEPTTGIPMVEPEFLKEVVTMLDAEDFQVHFHAIGDGAIRQALDSIEAARTANGASDHRHHISHLELIDPADIPRFAALDTVANFQPLWAYPDDYITELTVPFIGEERAQWLYPIRSVIDAGGKVAFGSDWSVSTANPFSQIETAVTRMDIDANEGDVLLPEQRITVAQAIEAFTINAAFVNHHDDETGSVEAGKLADLIVVDQNLLEIEPTAISDTKVLLTLFGGQPVYGSLALERP